jgi:hypothetical protein
MSMYSLMYVSFLLSIYTGAGRFYIRIEEKAFIIVHANSTDVRCKIELIKIMIKMLHIFFIFYYN